MTIMIMIVKQKLKFMQEFTFDIIICAQAFAKEERNMRAYKNFLYIFGGISYKH